MNGKHSDITVHCFGTSYALHRLLLDRAPFFCSALSEPWFESTAKEITLHPEELDSNITQAAFELALRRIYGCADANEEDEHPIGLFATGCWLEMSDLIDVSVACILKQMAPYSLADCIKFVTSNYYGKHGEKILTAAKAMLCREGYEMLLKNFNGISAVLIRETISSDAFYVPGEWERWILSKKIFNRRVRARALNLGIINADNSLKVPRPRMSPHILRDQVACEPELELDTNIWIQLYADPEISPLYELLDTGIHYMHMSFEQLQHVKAEMDVLKMIPLVIETVISNALWQSMLLRQSVINATEADIELGFTEMVQDRDDLSRTITGESDQEILVNDATTQQEDQSEENSTQSEQSDNKPSQSPKYWIPVSDSAYQMGTGSEIISETICSQDRSTRTHSFDHIDTMGAGGFSNRIAEDTSPKVSNCPGPKLLYTKFPPFRFAAEFPPTKSLKENETVYSNTVWYAGSLWNVYIQKQETLKNTQLGIYLHREKHLAGAEDFMRNVAQSTHVDERISSIEKELYLRQRTRRRLDNVSAQPLGDGYDFYADLLRSRMPPDLDTISGLLRPRSSIPRSSEGGQARDQPLNTAGAFNREKDETKNLGNTIRKPALPIYVDSRSIIKTYFKIYAPSRGGRMMSVYESAPDQFNFSRNLGWKSTNLVVDDNTDVSEDGISSNEPRLRFMFVIGKPRVSQWFRVLIRLPGNV